MGNDGFPGPGELWGCNSGTLKGGTSSDGKVLISQRRFITGTQTYKPESLSKFATEKTPAP